MVMNLFSSSAVLNRRELHNTVHAIDSVFKIEITKSILHEYCICETHLRFESARVLNSLTRSPILVSNYYLLDYANAIDLSRKRWIDELFCRVLNL